MSLKSASLFALIGMILATVLLAAGFLRDLSGFLSGAIAVVAVLHSGIYLFASVGLTVFLFVFHRSQS